MSRLLVEAGEALYGPRWQSDLARDLGVADRTVRRWATGVTNPPPGVYADLMQLAIKRAKRLDDLADRLRAA